MTAALAGPGLLFALWALDVWREPAWGLAIAAGVAALALLAVWSFLTAGAPESHRFGRREAVGGAVFVALLVAAGLLLPAAVNDPPSDEQTSRTVREIRDALREDARARAARDERLAAALEELARP